MGGTGRLPAPGDQRCLLLFKGSSHLPQQLKFTTSDSCDRIKDEFQLLQAQYHRYVLPCATGPGLGLPRSLRWAGRQWHDV